MVIEINDVTTLRQVQEQFLTLYPYLNLIFLHRPFKKHPAGIKLIEVPVDVCIGDIKRTHVSGLIEIEPWNTIADIEKEFILRFGIRVMVLQKSDDHWVQPVGIDSLTLKEQNEAGFKAAQRIIHPDYNDRVEESEY